MARPLDVLNVVGHDLFNPGAKSPWGDEWLVMMEWSPSFRRAQKLEGLKAGLDGRRAGVDGYDARYDDLIARCIERNPRVLFDFHHNGGGYPGVTGLYPPGNEAAKRIAELACRALAEAQGTKYRGVRDSAGEDGRPRAWTGKETESADGNWYPAGSVLKLLDELKPPILPVVLEFYDGSVKSDFDAAMAAFKSGASQAALAGAVVQFFAELDGGASV